RPSDVQWAPVDLETGICGVCRANLLVERDGRIGHGDLQLWRRACVAVGGHQEHLGPPAGLGYVDTGLCSLPARVRRGQRRRPRHSSRLRFLERQRFGVRERDAEGKRKHDNRNNGDSAHHGGGFYKPCAKPRIDAPCPAATGLEAMRSRTRCTTACVKLYGGSTGGVGIPYSPESEDTWCRSRRGDVEVARVRVVLR